jgi:hypothetical protein
MKQIAWIILLLTLSTYISSQDLKFNNAADYGNWIMGYYKNPQPDYLFEAFKYGVNSEEVANAGSRDLVLSFFAAIFRQDTSVQIDFFNRLKTETNQNLRLGYIFSLWFADGDHSKRKLREFQQLMVNGKDVTDIDSLLKTRPIDIFNDSIRDPTHLDMCWADFFATGRELGVLKIITGLKNINSTDYYKKNIALSARWSLRNNAYRHEKVYKIISDQIENGESDFTEELTSILEEVNAKKGR